ncbi:MAG: ABC transporter ATP-binding protein [Deltaproteobacteria bacterium]|nr:ABC transporter ATP-binding protein [Deltaproteobacteria bacterium]
MDGKGAAAGEGGWFVRTEKLCKRYDPSGPNAVDSLDIAIHEGEIFGILGPNGAGKTTTLAMLSGLMRPDSGSVRFGEGIDQDRIREVIGYVPQELALYNRLTGRENLEFFGRLYGVTGSRLRGRIDELLDLVGLSDRADEPIQRYSTGMMRRLNLAAGLIHEPKLLLLDEPTVGIDPQSRNRIFESILGLRDAGVTILYTTHYMEEVSRLCDRISIMDRGRVILEGEPAQLVRRYGHFRMEFKADDCPASFAGAIESLEPVISAFVSGRVLAVITGTDHGRMELIEEIGRMSREAGVTLSLRRILEPDLEGLFLDITGRSLKDGVS